MMNNRIRHQCPNCLTAHFNRDSRLCPPCDRKAFTVDLIGAALCFGVVGLIGLFVLSL